MKLERQELTQFVEAMGGPGAVITLFRLWESSKKFRGRSKIDPKKTLSLTKVFMFKDTASRQKFQTYQINSFLRNRRQIEKDMPAIYKMLAQEAKAKKEEGEKNEHVDTSNGQ